MLHNMSVSNITSITVIIQFHNRVIYCFSHLIELSTWLLILWNYLHLFSVQKKIIRKHLHVIIVTVRRWLYAIVYNVNRRFVTLINRWMIGYLWLNWPLMHNHLFPVYIWLSVIFSFSLSIYLHNRDAHFFCSYLIYYRVMTHHKETLISWYQYLIMRFHQECIR